MMTTENMLKSLNMSYSTFRRRCICIPELQIMIGTKNKRRRFYTAKEYQTIIENINNVHYKPL